MIITICPHCSTEKELDRLLHQLNSRNTTVCFSCRTKFYIKSNVKRYDSIAEEMRGMYK